MGAVVYKEDTAGASGRLRPTGGGVRRKGGDDAAGRVTRLLRRVYSKRDSQGRDSPTVKGRRPLQVRNHKVIARIPHPPQCAHEVG